MTKSIPGLQHPIFSNVTKEKSPDTMHHLKKIESQQQHFLKQLFENSKGGLLDLKNSKDFQIRKVNLSGIKDRVLDSSIAKTLRTEDSASREVDTMTSTSRFITENNESFRNSNQFFRNKQSITNILKKKDPTPVKIKSSQKIVNDEYAIKLMRNKEFKTNQNTTNGAFFANLNIPILGKSPIPPKLVNPLKISFNKLANSPRDKKIIAPRNLLEKRTSFKNL